MKYEGSRSKGLRNRMEQEPTREDICVPRAGSGLPVTSSDNASVTRRVPYLLLYEVHMK